MCRGDQGGRDCQEFGLEYIGIDAAASYEDGKENGSKKASDAGSFFYLLVFTTILAVSYCLG